MSLLASTLRRATATAAARSAARAWAAPATRSFGVTYSGGHASVGQGGFYGSGGARALKVAAEQADGAVAAAEDVELMKDLMAKVSAMDAAAAKEAMGASDAAALLERLEFGGQPVWGLTLAERDMVTAARALSE